MDLINVKLHIFSLDSRPKTTLKYKKKMSLHFKTIMTSMKEKKEQLISFDYLSI